MKDWRALQTQILHINISYRLPKNTSLLN
jgi:hypothetical protein